RELRSVGRDEHVLVHEAPPTNAYRTPQRTQLDLATRVRRPRRTCAFRSTGRSRRLHRQRYGTERLPELAPLFQTARPDELSLVHGHVGTAVAHVVPSIGTEVDGLDDQH